MSQPAPTSEVNNLRSLLTSLGDRTEGESVSVADLLNAVGRRSHGPVLLLLGFIAVSPLSLVPGANWLVALVTFIFAMQIVVGLKYPWLPRRALAVSFPRKYLLSGIKHLEPHAYVVDQILQPRLVFLTRIPFINIVALACVAAALITIPLGLIPFGPLLPGLTVLLFGLAITARDGAVLLIAGAALFGAGLLLMKMLPRIMSFFGG
ncbi:exopolysaccharide biosynthesis protein [Henriciella sp.]|uniref:exopolysaccharide biosynthesis protein n=1 Tax=Henriciella sp. TaxID=1968823 RepID=UPI00261F2FCA|nr:exopolysaccharide biosynthesis protein [Henriciella sp.]